MFTFHNEVFLTIVTLSNFFRKKKLLLLNKTNVVDENMVDNVVNENMVDNNNNVDNDEAGSKSKEARMSRLARWVFFENSTQ